MSRATGGLLFGAVVVELAFIRREIRVIGITRCTVPTTLLDLKLYILEFLMCLKTSNCKRRRTNHWTEHYILELFQTVIYRPVRLRRVISDIHC
jgi:hypothetical protein